MHDGRAEISENVVIKILKEKIEMSDFYSCKNNMCATRTCVLIILTRMRQLLLISPHPLCIHMVISDKWAR